MARRRSCRGWKSVGKVCSLRTLAGQLRLDPGAIAQLVERFVRIEEVRSSNLLSSTLLRSRAVALALNCQIPYGQFSVPVRGRPAQELAELGTL